MARLPREVWDLIGDLLPTVAPLLTVSRGAYAAFRPWIRSHAVRPARGTGKRRTGCAGTASAGAGRGVRPRRTRCAAST